MADILSSYAVKELFSALARTASANGSGIDLNADQPFGPVTLLLSIGAASGTTPTLDVKLQDSADGASWADISGAAFAQKTAAGFGTLQISTWRRHIRAVATIAGTTPSFTFSVVGLIEKSVK